MRYYLFGMDAREPVACARALREKGYGGVVSGSRDARLIEAVQGQELQYDLSAGAFGLGGGFSRLAEDCEGEARRWFGSGCPSDPAMRAERLARLEEMAHTPGVRAVMLDGARFASFASSEGVESFFTCFCPACLRSAEEMGFDPGRMREGARALRRFTQTGEGNAEAALMGVGEWMAFREESVSRFLSDFARAVHSAGKLAGAFVFAPSLSGWVGQRRAGACGLDILAPMVYRRYPHADGPACLNHEWAALLRLLTEKTGLSRGEAARLVNAPALSADVLADGFACDQVGREVEALATEGRAYRLSPILQREDDRLAQSIRAAEGAGADEVGLFAFDRMDNVPDLRALGEVMP